MADELDGATDEILAHWMGQFGKLMEWCASGDYTILPVEIQEYIRTNHEQMLAIEA